MSLLQYAVNPGSSMTGRSMIIDCEEVKSGSLNDIIERLTDKYAQYWRVAKEQSLCWRKSAYVPSE